MPSYSARFSEEVALKYRGNRALKGWLLLFKDGLGIVDNINYVARLSRCRREENGLVCCQYDFFGN
jgi:hypothetical protein